MKKVYIWLQRLGYVLAGMLFLLFVCVYIAVQSGYIARKIQNITEHFFNQEHGCQFQGQVSKINLFPPRVEISGLTLQKPDEHDWSIHVNHTTLQFHLLDMVKKRQIGYDLILDGVHLQEQFDKVPHKIADFLGSLSSQDDSLLELKRIYIAQGLVVGTGTSRPIHFSLNSTGMVTLHKHGAYLSLQLDSGSLHHHDIGVLQNFSGSLQGFLPANQDRVDVYEIDLDMHTDIPVLQEEKVHAKLRLQKGQITATMADSLQQVFVDSFVCDLLHPEKLCSLHASTDLRFLQEKPWFYGLLRGSKGLVKIGMQCSGRDPLATLEGNIGVYDLAYKSICVAEHVDVALHPIRALQYEFIVTVDSTRLLSGSVQSNQSGQLGVDIRNDHVRLMPFGLSEWIESSFKGRMSLFKIMTIIQGFLHLITQGATPCKVQKQARNVGMALLVQDGVRKIEQGLTTMSELLSVVTNYE